MKPKVPPVVVMLATAALMWGADALLPGLALRFAGTGLLALVFLAAGVIVSFAAVSRFARTGTTSDPLNPERARELVTDGIYRYTRNPMYLGMACALAAWGFFLANAGSLILVFGFVAFITQFQIKREERALHDLFGERYAEYKASVRRWL